jgi:ABC-type multidrug transport system fused ATPase/permease subunit
MSATAPTTSRTKKAVDYSGAWSEARTIVSSHRGPLAVGLALTVVSRLSGMVLPATSKMFIDDVVGKHRSDLLLPLALASLGATLLQAGTSFALSQVVGVAAQRVITDMRKNVEAHITRLPIRYFDSTQTGVLISRIMTDAEGVRNLVGTGFVQMVGGLLQAVVALVVLFRLNWHLTLGTLVIMAAFAGVMSWAFSRFRPVFRERGKIQAEITGRLGESLGGARIVKAYTAERREDLVFARGAHRLLRNIAESMTGVSGANAMSTVIIGFIGVVMILLGGRAMLAGEMTPGGFLQYLLFTGLMAGPMVEMSAIGTQITEAFAGLDRIREVMHMPTEDAGDRDRDALETLQGDIVFEDVWFEYDKDQPVLKGVSFRAPAGSTTALVGSSGSGKSTLIGLVMAYHRPKTGRVTVDGHDLGSLRLRDYRGHLGVVLQDNFLFDGTIRENVSFSRPSAPFERIREASAIAHCDEFIAKFPKQWDTIVGERGVKLSGGQRQRVAIARAILADPRVLILDEATSSLDSESEAMIQDGLKALRAGRTTFVIAHRLSTIRSADLILVLEHGEIVERGTHAALMALGGRYRELHDRQYQVEFDRFINPGEDFTPELPVARPIREGEESRPPVA